MVDDLDPLVVTADEGTTYTVLTVTTTEIEGELVVGGRVKVEGWLESDDTALAREIESWEEDDD